MLHVEDVFSSSSSSEDEESSEEEDEEDSEEETDNEQVYDDILLSINLTVIRLFYSMASQTCLIATPFF